MILASFPGFQRDYLPSLAQTEDGTRVDILALRLGHVGFKVSPSHHILKSFSSQVLGGFTNSWSFIGPGTREANSFLD